MRTDNMDKHLLVIDDEIEITKTLSRQFRRKFKVHTATNGKDALAIMEQEPVQVVLSDQRMPGMTGVDFFSKIKQKYPDTIKLILTGYSDIEAVVGAINQGQVFRYLTKPWNPLELDIAINEAFEKHDLIIKNKHLMKALKQANVTLEEKVKERTAELKKTNDRLKKLNIEKNKYIGIVAHDLRNPIGNAYNFSELLLSEHQRFSRQEQVRFLGFINERCSYSLRLIEDFLDVSKIEAGILNLNFEKFNLVEIIEDCIEQNNIFLKRKSQTINFEPENNIRNCAILCDKDKIEQVINNLLSNAIKYSDEKKNIWITVKMEGNKILTSVKDEGIGIPENELDTIFKDYTTTSAEPTAGEKPTGLGLAIAKKIMDAHKGRISVNSKVGVGSEFILELAGLQ
jgi:signal transduction histidine kinase